MSFDINRCVSGDEQPGRKASENRPPTPNEKYWVVKGMACNRVTASKLGTSRDYIIDLEQEKRIAREDLRKLDFQMLVTNDAYLLSGFDPKRSNLGKAFEQAGDQLSSQDYDHKKKAYIVTHESEQLPMPEVPFASLSEFIESEFADRIVDRDDHPVLVKYLKNLAGN